MNRAIYTYAYYIADIWTFSKIIFLKKAMVWWRRGVVVITTAQLHSTKPGFRFCASLNLARGASKSRDSEDL